MPAPERGGHLRIVGARLIDPARGMDEPADLWVRAGRVAALSPPGRLPAAAARDPLLRASGLWLVPGFVDLHVHLRDPGQTEAEDLDSGARAAAAGGFTTVVCMPNTRPPLDRADRLRRLMTRLRRKDGVRVIPAAALSLGLAGRTPVSFEALVRAGAGAFSDDGVGTADEAVLAAALEASLRHRVPVMVHCEDRRISAGGVARPGMAARRLRLAPWPSKAEWVSVARHLRTLERAPGHLHLQHLSCARSLDLLRAGRARGLHVTAEVTPHHLALSDRDLPQRAYGGGADPNFKMNPPLPAERDRRALLRALRDGTIDAVATDHAPHTVRSKSMNFTEAPFGVVGMETAAAVLFSLVQDGTISRVRWCELLSTGPARVIGIDRGHLGLGALADMVLFDPEESWVPRAEEFLGKSANSPFLGQRLRGRVRATFIMGRCRYWRARPRG